MHAGGGQSLHQAILEHSIRKGDLGKENIFFQSFSRRCDNGTWFAYQSAGCPAAMAPHVIDVLYPSQKRRCTSKGSMHLKFCQCFWILCPRKTLNLIRWSVGVVYNGCMLGRECRWHVTWYLQNICRVSLLNLWKIPVMPQNWNANWNWSETCRLPTSCKWIM